MNAKCFGLGILGVVAMLGACASAPEGEFADDTTTDSATEALSVSTASYVTLRRDLRKCVSPMCGGYFVKQLNLSAAERYVSGLDLTYLGFSPEDEARVLSSPDGELVLRGSLGHLDRRFHTRPLLVNEAYRGMPGITPVAGDAFYTVSPREPRVLCFAAPCPNEEARTVNKTATTLFDGMCVDRASKVFVDRHWLVDRALAHGAIVQGKLVRGQHFPGGYERLLSASQVYERVGRGPTFDLSTCAAEEVRSDECNLDRWTETFGCEPELAQ